MGRAVYVIDSSISHGKEEFLTALDELQISRCHSLPADRHQPVIVLVGGDVRDIAAYSELKYCLLVGANCGNRALPIKNATLVEPGALPLNFVECVRDWLTWVDVDAAEDLTSCHLVGRSLAFCQAIARMRSIADFDAVTLLRGETGTGKEGAARAIHYWSSRRDSAFVPINCGGQNDDLFVSELFGHEKGAFTDAKERRAGLIANAEGGTLFLDEVNSLSAKSQAALLRFLQDQSYRAIGSKKSMKANVRVIAASNQPLEPLIAQGQFRRDLFYRLDVLSIELPPLRHRRQDLPLLAEHFMNQLCATYGGKVKVLDARTLSWILTHSWPGNVRELQNFLHRLFTHSHGPEMDASLTASDATKSINVAQREAERAFGTFQDEKNTAIERFERQYLNDLLRSSGGNVSLAARRAGKERSAFGRLLRKYRISGRAYRDPAIGA